MEGQRLPHLTALTRSRLLLCFLLGEPTRNLKARALREGREWICGERGDKNGKTTYLEAGGIKRARRQG